jgi:hypothetical protein
VGDGGKVYAVEPSRRCVPDLKRIWH